MNHEKNVSNQPHNIIMESRKNLSVSGVTDVESFDEQSVILYTTMGQLTVKGNNLHLERLNTNEGDVGITGNIYGMIYTDEREKGGFFSRILR